MRRKKRNTKTIEMTLPACPIGISDACFRVKDKDGIIGELQVSKGAVVWFPKVVLWERPPYKPFAL